MIDCYLSCSLNFNSSLTIKNATLADEGNYQCMGSNYGGKIWSKNMTLLVGGKLTCFGFDSEIYPCDRAKEGLSEY